MFVRDFLCGPVVKNLPCNEGDMGSIPGQGSKIHVPWATEPTCFSSYWSPHSQLESPCTTTKDPTWCSEDPTETNKYFLNEWMWKWTVVGRDFCWAQVGMIEDANPKSYAQTFATRNFCPLSLSKEGLMFTPSAWGFLTCPWKYVF